MVCHPSALVHGRGEIAYMAIADVVSKSAGLVCESLSCNRKIEYN